MLDKDGIYRSGTFDTIAGLVILYNPDILIIENIKSYISKINTLYVIDNSKVQNVTLVKQLLTFKKIRYTHYEENIGIAKALNIAAEWAINDNYDLLLTMDQDSSLSTDTIDIYSNFLATHTHLSVGLLTLYHHVKNFNKRKSKNTWSEVQTAFTSGSLINLRAFTQIGPFEEKYFIDYVDHEFCLRLRANGFKIIQINSAICYHQLGNLVSKNILGLEIPATNHSSIRIYYRTRNRFDVAKKYFITFPVWVIIDLIRFMYEILITIFFETKKTQKIQMAFIGFFDFVRNKYGKIEIEVLQ
jgi:rhamnosyltransferase